MIKRALLLVAAILLLVFTLLLVPSPRQPAQVYGVAFSAKQAENIGLDWRETQRALLDDLGIRRFRLAAYWDTIESEEGKRNFAVLDEQMDAIAKRGGKTVLAVGVKLPRWPECHIPVWAEGLSADERRRKAMVLMEDIINRYKNHPALSMWQLENEPFLDFGNCPERNTAAFMRDGESLIRSLDPNHPILVTDSGELSLWLKISGYGDIVGTTLYRTIYDGKQERQRSYDGIIPAAAYRARARLVKLIRGKEVIISELQAEPWGRTTFINLSAAERKKSMSAERLREVAEFARATQLPRAYLWGVEYWYWLKTVEGDDSLWEAAREIFKE